ncbi:hypothetical protein [Soonwooa purpurea]
MTKEDLKKANELNQSYLRADESFTNIDNWKTAHENSERDLSLSNVDSGWVTIPNHRKQEVLDLVWDIAKDLYDKAREEFEAFNPK